jgi:predicted aspartyl protease
MYSVRIRLVRLVAVRLALLGAACALPCALAADARQPGDAIRFSLIDDYLIVVPVMVNGEGPFKFLLDTGTTSSMIDPELERKLNATEIGGSHLATMSGERRDRRVRLDEVRVGQAAVSGLVALVDRLDAARALVPGARGILGEDFLRQFDIFIDYEKRSSLRMRIASSILKTKDLAVADFSRCAPHREDGVDSLVGHFVADHHLDL